MGGKPRKQPINVHVNGTKIFASHITCDPVTMLVPPSDKELFTELAIRGYDLSDFNFNTDDIEPKTKFFIHVPEGKYPLADS